MSLGLAVLLYFIFTVTLGLLPFIPALRELRNPQDDSPLRVSRESDVDIRHFAKGFHSFIEDGFADRFDRCLESGISLAGTLADGSRYLLIGNDDPLLFSEEEALNRASERLLLSTGDLELKGDASFLGEIYSRASIQGGPRNIYRALLADGDIRLDEQSTTLRWLHGEGRVEANRECCLHGRVSAGEVIALTGGCRFERLGAKRIEFGQVMDDVRQPDDPETRPRVEERSPHQLHRKAKFSARRCLVDTRKLDVPPSSLLDYNLVATGELRIGMGCRILGSIKSHSDIILDEKVEITGSVVAGRNLRVSSGCRINGLVIAEGDTVLCNGTVIGTADKPTTVSVESLLVEPGTLVHGSVWAHQRGEVLELDRTEEVAGV
jgi:cytoskeletal protein CcmA (bactofilin family)